MTFTSGITLAMLLVNPLMVFLGSLATDASSDVQSVQLHAFMLRI